MRSSIVMIALFWPGIVAQAAGFDTAAALAKLPDRAKAHYARIQYGSLEAISQVHFTANRELHVADYGRQKRLWLLLARWEEGKIQSMLGKAPPPCAERIASSMRGTLIRLPEGTVKRFRPYRQASLNPKTLEVVSPYYEDSFDSRIEMWASNDLVQVNDLGRSGFPTPISATLFSPDGARLYVGEESGRISVLDSQTQWTLGRTVSENGSVDLMAMGKKGRFLAAAYADGRALVWKIRRVATRVNVDFSADYALDSGARITAMAVSSDGLTLALGICRDARVYVQLLKRKSVEETAWESTILEGNEDLIRSILFSPDEKVLLAGGADKQIGAWDVSSGERIARLSTVADETVPLELSLFHHRISPDTQSPQLHGGNVYDMAFSPDGEILAVGTAQGLLLWHLRSGAFRNAR